jgi:hypothetical protein
VSMSAESEAATGVRASPRARLGARRACPRATLGPVDWRERSPARDALGAMLWSGSV